MRSGWIKRIGVSRRPESRIPRVVHGEVPDLTGPIDSAIDKIFRESGSRD